MKSITRLTIAIIIATVMAAAFATSARAATWSSSLSVNTTPTVATSTAFTASYAVAQGGTYNLDFELYDNNGNKVGQWFETRTVDSNASIIWNWTPASAGDYKAKLGIFNDSWQLISWNDNALTFAVGSENKATMTTNGYLRGVNLAGAEFAPEALPGVYGRDYTYPTENELDYYKSKGLTLVRLPFKWERLQNSLWAELNGEELGRIDTFVAAAKARGLKVILDPHNYARYSINGTKYLIGTPEVPNAAFKDFWNKLAGHFKGNEAIYGYGLMNEPYQTGGMWKAAAQAGLDGVRAADPTTLVLVPGDSWSGAWTWEQYNANLILSDPANNLVYEAHQYFDKDGSGLYNGSYEAEGAYANIGVDRLQPFLKWLKANNLRGIVTEFAVPNNDVRWQTVLENFLAKLDAEGLSSTYWGGGPWWGNYPLSCEPNNGADAAIMSVLARHTSK